MNLTENSVDMVLHCLFRKIQAIGNFLIRPAFFDKSKELLLPARQPKICSKAVNRCALREPVYITQEQQSEMRRTHRFTSCHRANCRDDIIRRGLSVQVANDSRAHRAQEIVFAVLDAQEDDFQPANCLEHLLNEAWAGITC